LCVEAEKVAWLDEVCERLLEAQGLKGIELRRRPYVCGQSQNKQKGKV
jgi:hypothetical protein